MEWTYSLPSTYSPVSHPRQWGDSVRWDDVWNPATGPLAEREGGAGGGFLVGEDGAVALALLYDRAPGQLACPLKE